jgi:hypothetical protein
MYSSTKRKVRQDRITQNCAPLFDFYDLQMSVVHVHGNLTPRLWAGSRVWKSVLTAWLVAGIVCHRFYSIPAYPPCADHQGRKPINLAKEDWILPYLTHSSTCEFLLRQAAVGLTNNHNLQPSTATVGVLPLPLATSWTSAVPCDSGLLILTLIRDRKEVNFTRETCNMLSLQMCC